MHFALCKVLKQSAILDLKRERQLRETIGLLRNSKKNKHILNQNYLAKKNGETEPIKWKEMKANIKETSDKVLGKHKFEPTKSCHRS